MSTVVLFGDIYEAILAERSKKGACEKDILDRVQEKFGGCLNVANKMNEFKYPVKEIIQAVEEIQTKKGPTMTPVSDFVRIYKKNLEDPQKDKFVLKTIKTLKKLAEDGVLTKTGKRYMYNTANCGDEEEEEEDEDDEEEEGDDEDCGDDNEEEDKNGEKKEEDCNEDNDNDNEEDTGPCCDPGGDEDNENEDDDCGNEGEEGGEEGNEEGQGDDDDDDIDDDEEDDDDDGEDDNCKNQDTCEPREMMHICQKGRDKKDSLKEKGNFQCRSMDNMTLKNTADVNERKCMNSRGEKGTPDETMIDASPEKVVREGETFAFCVRDFIDSLYRARSSSKLKEEFAHMDAETFESMDANELKVGKNLKGRKGKFLGTRNKTSRAKYRSRSPLKKNKPNTFNTMKKDVSDILCCRVINSQYSQEPMDEYMDNDKDIEIEYESFHHRNPLAASPSSGSRGGERRKSIISIEDQRKTGNGFPDSNKILTGSDEPPNMITAFEVDEIQSRPFNIDVEETSEEDKRKMFFDDDVSIKDDDDDKASFCSRCEN